jgi:hypothetical protein
MSDGPVGLAKSDLRLLYAKVNAHEALLRAIIRVLADSSDDPDSTLEILRVVAMDEGDTMTRSKNTSDPEFDEQGMIETLGFIAGTFDYVKGTSG